MAELIELPTFSDERGNLTVLEKCLPFDVKRIFYIYGVDSSTRGCHRHKQTTQALIAINGSCIVSNNGPDKEVIKYQMDSPDKCLILYPEDWHKMHDFSEGTVLLVLASHHFDEADYIFENYS